MFKFLDDIVNEVGEEHVIKITMDSALNMKNAGKKTNGKETDIVVDKWLSSGRPVHD